MKIRLKPIFDQVVVLFGATSGIGLETALSMAKKGANVVIVGRSQDGLNEAVERVREIALASPQMRGRRNRTDGGLTAEETVLGIEADATEWDQVKQVADQTVATFGRIDTWVHLAAVSEWALFEDTSPDEFRRIVDVNLVGSAYGAMAVLPYMKQQQGGSIILISSITGRVPMPYQTAYSASKHGILGMADALRMELKHNEVPVSVTTILPASINTPLFSKGRTKLGVEPHPIPPVYDPHLVAEAIIYAAQHPVREMMVGGAGYALQSIRRLSQPAANAYVSRTAFRQQRSDEVKSAQEPDNLYHHVAGHNQILGEYAPETRKFSLYTWFTTHPIARIALLAVMLGGATFLGVRAIRARRKRTVWQKLGHQLKSMQKSVGHVRMPDVHMPSVSLPRLRREPTLRERVAHKVNSIHMPDVHMPSVSMPRLRRERNFREKVAHTFDSVHMPDVHMPSVSMPRLRREPTLQEKVAHSFNTLRENLPIARRRASWWESIPFLSLLPFLRRDSAMDESAMDGAKKQFKKATGRMNEAMGTVEKKVRDANLKDRLPSVPVRRPAYREKQVSIDKFQERIPGGTKETVYEKVEEKGPRGTKEVVFEKVEETRHSRNS